MATIPTTSLVLIEAAQVNLDVELPWATYCASSSDGASGPASSSPPTPGLSVAVRRAPSHQAAFLTDPTPPTRRWLHFAREANDRQLLSRYELKRRWSFFWVSPFDSPEAEGEYWRFTTWRARWEYPVLLFLGSVVFASIIGDIPSDALKVFAGVISAVFFLAAFSLLLALLCTRSETNIAVQRLLTQSMFTIMPGACLAIGIIVTITMHAAEGKNCGLKSRFSGPNDTCIRVMPTNYIALQTVTAIIIRRLEVSVPLLVLCQIGAIVAFSTNNDFDQTSLALFGMVGFITIAFHSVSSALLIERARLHFQLAVSVHLTRLDAAEQATVLAAAAVVALPRAVGLRLQSIVDVKRGSVRQSAFDCAAAAVVVLVRVRNTWGAYKGDGASMARCLHRVATFLDREVLIQELDSAGVLGDDFTATTGLHHPMANVIAVVRFLATLPKLTAGLEGEAPSSSPVARNAKMVTLCAVANVGSARGRLIGSRGARYMVTGPALSVAQQVIAQVPDHSGWLHEVVRDEALSRCLSHRERMNEHFKPTETSPLLEIALSKLDAQYYGVAAEDAPSPSPSLGAADDLVSPGNSLPGAAGRYLSSSSGLATSGTAAADAAPSPQRRTTPSIAAASMNITSVIRFVDSDATETDGTDDKAAAAPDDDAGTITKSVINWFGSFADLSIEANYVEYTMPQTAEAFRQTVLFHCAFYAVLFLVLAAEIAADPTLRGGLPFAAIVAGLAILGVMCIATGVASAMMRIENVTYVPFPVVVVSILVMTAGTWAPWIFLHETFTSNRPQFIACVMVPPVSMIFARLPWSLSWLLTWLFAAVPPATLSEYNSPQGTVSYVAVLVAYGVMAAGLTRLHSLEGRYRFASTAIAATTVALLEQNGLMLRDVVFNAVPKHVLPHAVRAILDAQNGSTLPPLKPYVSDHFVDLVCLKVLMTGRTPVSDLTVDHLVNRITDSVSANFAASLVVLQTLGDAVVIVGGLTKVETDIIVAIRHCFEFIKQLSTVESDVGFIAAAGVEEGQGALIGNGASLRYVVVGRVVQQCTALLELGRMPPTAATAVHEPSWGLPDGTTPPFPAGEEASVPPLRAFFVTREFHAWLAGSTDNGAGTADCDAFKPVRVRDADLGLREVFLHSPPQPHAEAKFHRDPSEKAPMLV